MIHTWNRLLKFYGFYGKRCPHVDCCSKFELLLEKNSNFSSSAVLCFMEIWLCGSISDSVLIWLASSSTEQIKTLNSLRICLYTDCGCYNDITVIQQHCCSDLTWSHFSLTVSPFTPLVSSCHWFWSVFTSHRKPMCQRHRSYWLSRYWESRRPNQTRFFIGFGQSTD